jgi:hypothetical protein
MITMYKCACGEWVTRIYSKEAEKELNMKHMEGVG